MKTKLLFLFWTMTFLLTSCGEIQESAEPAVLHHMVVGSNLNESITVSAPEGWNTYKIDETVALAVVLQSSKPVYLNEKDIQADVLIDNEWRSVNTIKRKTDFETVLYFHEVIAQRIASLDVAIDLSDGNYSKGGVFRFLVIGHIFENQVKGEKVFAYVDVELFP